MMTKTCIRSLVWLLVLLMATPPCIFAQPIQPPAEVQPGAPPPPPAAPLFSTEELDQMLAPIALYPDSLLVQVLMAATYPMEIVEANRWLAANPNLRGEQLAAAVDKKSWDPSVKSLINFPTVLGMMDQKIEWTERLGDAFLSQKDQVMDEVQRLRMAAQNQGALRTTNEQRVVTEGRTIIIEPINPQVVYVPAYDPLVVYGPWWYPAYPPYPYYPLGAVIVGAAIAFGVGIALGACWGWAWGGFGWGHHSVNINVYQNVVYNRHINHGYYAHRYGGGGHGVWQHDPAHRRGVAYRDQSLTQRYGQGARGGAGFRGHTPGAGRPGTVGGPGRGGGAAAQMQSERGRQSRGGIASPRGGPPQTMRRPGTGAGGGSVGRPSHGMGRTGGGAVSRPSTGGSAGHRGTGAGGGHPGGGAHGGGGHHR